MPLRVRIAGVVAVTAALIGLSPAVAYAEPEQVRTADVVKAMALPAEPTDFVVLVDTSRSMSKGKRPQAVRSALTQLLKIMQPTDRLALFTYDAEVTAQYRGLVGAHSAASLARLPASATPWSDQGIALESGVAELARAGANPQAVVVVMTDGGSDAGAGSAYQSKAGKAWSDLIGDGNRLAEQRPIASYQFNLSSAANAVMLGQVFPSTRAVKASAVSRQVQSIRDDLDRLRAAQVLEAELAAPIAVSWTGAFGAESDGWLPIRVTVTSPYPHVPIVLNDLAVSAAGGHSAEVSGLPKVIELAPGQTKELDAQIQLSGDGDLSDLTLSFAAAVDSPWRSVLRAALGLHFAPAVVTVDGASPRGALERSLPTVVTVGGLLGLSVLVWWLGGALISPRMRGELIFSHHAGEVARVALRGRRQYLTALPGSGALATLSGTVYGARPIRGKEREIRVDLVAGKNWSRGVIQDGHVLQMGDMEIAYSSEPGAIVRPVLVH